MLGQFIKFIFKRKKFFLIPIIIIIGILGLLSILGQGTVYAPFIYTVF